MEWKNQAINKYPDIICTDSVITDIQMDKGNVVVDFSKYGFFIKDDCQKKYYRTDGAQIAIEGCDIDSIIIKEARTHQLSETIYFDSIYDIEVEDFQKNISGGRWKFEIVEEFYSTSGGLYIGQIRENETTFWCYIQIKFEKLIYFWNDLQYEYPF